MRGKQKSRHFCDFDGCSRAFSTSGQMMYHMKTEHIKAGVNLNCKSCNENFDTVRKFRQHEKLHKKTFKCDFCQKLFYQLSDLKRHTKIHEKQKEFMCTLRQKGFSFKHNLTKHIRLFHSDVN